MRRLAYSVALVTALVLTADAAHASTPRIVSPQADQLVTAPRVTVNVRTANTATRVTATLDGRDAKLRFRRTAPGRWTATMRRTALRPGVNHITISARAGGGTRSSAPVRVYAGTRRRAFTQVRVGTRVNGSVPVSLRTSADPRLRLAATLNGRPVARVFAPRYGARRTARLGADDGLRRGRNVLRVTAIRRDGGYTVVRRVFHVSASQTLIGAGAHRRTTPRRSVTLRGRLAAPGARSSSGAVRWQVLSAPKGSTARPASPMQLVTRFTPDRVGTYVLRLTAGSGARAPLDEVTVSSVANTPPIGIPVTTITERAGIVIGGSTYSYDPNQFALQAVFLDRGTLEVVYQNAFVGTAADANTLLGVINQNPGALVFLGNLDFGNQSVVNPAFNTVVQRIGGTATPAITNGSGGGWSVVGIAQGAAGSAFQNNGTAQNSANPTQGQMDGYLQIDSSDQFAFVPAERLALDLAASGAPAGQNQMTVGSATYASGPLTSGGTACSGGIQIQTLSAENLIASSGQTFATNGCGAGADAANLQAATAYLQGLGAGTSAGTLLVLIQTIGVPRDPSTDSALWQQFTNAVVSIGGTAAAVGDGSGSYSLAAGIGIPDMPLVEGSSALTGQPARVTAVLQRARNGNFTPKLSSWAGAFTFDLATLAYQAAQPFNPTTGQQAALAYIAETVLGLDAPTQESSCYVPATPDVRSQYCNSKYYTSWSGFANQLSALSPRSGPGFTTDDWNTVVGQLAPSEGRGEFRAVQSLWSTIQTMQLGSAQNAAPVVATAQAEAAAIASELTSPSSALGNWLSLSGDLSDAADRLVDVVSEDLAGPLGFLAAGLLIGADTANLPDGAPDVGAFEVSAANFAAQLASSYGEASGQLNQLGNLIVTDAGKLTTFDQGSQYGFNPTSAIWSAIRLGAAQFSWTSLFPSAFTLARLPRGTGINQGITDANSYQCSTMDGSDSGSYYPFNNAQPSQQLLTSELFVLVFAGSTLPNGSNYETPRMPSPAFMNPLFAPYSTNGSTITQYGMVRPWFFRNAYANGGTATVNC